MFLVSSPMSQLMCNLDHEKLKWLLHSMYDGWFFMTLKAAAVWVLTQVDLECYVLIFGGLYCVLFLCFIILSLSIQKYGQWLSENFAVPLVLLIINSIYNFCS